MNTTFVHQRLTRSSTGLRKGFRRRRGMALIYTAVVMMVLIGFVSMSVDLGRVVVAKTQLRVACDAAARFGAAGLKNILYGQSAAQSNAVNAAAANLVDGAPLVLDPVNDVQLGVWNTTTNTFTPNSDPTVANAVRVTARRVASRGTGIPLMFLGILGRSSFDITAQATAMVIPGASINATVPATSNPFLAGAPKNTSASNNNPHNDPDWSAGSTNPPSNLGGVHVAASPYTVPSSIPITPGTSMTFDGINGGANNDFNDPARYTADGNLSQIVSNTAGSEHGISNINAPINCLIGVFLNSSVPGSTSAPPSLDFTTQAARDYESLSPQLNQTFFIGDGRTTSGDVQHVVVPNGATRLFIATMDAYEWNNNIGAFNVTIHAPSTVMMVQ